MLFAFPYTRRTFGNMQPVAHVIQELTWDSDRVAVLMAQRNISSRYALAKTLGISGAVVHEAFDKDWRGRATTHLLAVMCSYFRVRMSDLVLEPVVQMHRLNTAQMQRNPNTSSARVVS